MAETKSKTNGKPPVNVEEEEGEDWEYEDEEAGDYEWEYGSEDEDEEEDGDEGHKASKSKAEESDTQLDEEDLPDPFSAVPLESTTQRDPGKTNGHANGNGTTGNGNGLHVEEKKKKKGETEDEEKKHRKHHKKSRHLERMDLFKKEKDGGDDFRSKKIHVRSKDPSRIARQFEKGMNSSSKQKGKGGVNAPPPMKVNQNCKICGKEPYIVERIVAEKSWWHKNCFRCKTCTKALTLDTYMSHEGILYCKPHHRELFQPKVVVREHDEPHQTRTQEAIERHKMQELAMETIVRENKPVDLGDKVVKSGRNDKYAGLEDLDVGSKFRMFEKKSSESPEREARGPASDRFGIMEKLKRLQDGEDLDELLAEINEELPSEEEDEDADPYLTNVQKRTQNQEKLFSEGGQERRDKMAEERKRELKTLRQKLMAGTKDNLMDQFDDLLNASANKVKKTKVDVRSENAKKFREMFDKGQVPEGTSKETDKAAQEKEAELEMMRKGRKDQRDFFKKMESGQLEEKQTGPKEKRLVRNIKDTEGDEIVDEDMLEMAPLKNRFSFFENFKDKEEERQKQKKGRASPTRDFEHGETDAARKECKARSVLNKFKEMETRAINGEPEEVTHDDPNKPVLTALGFLGRLPGVSEKVKRPNLKRFTPPRKLGAGQSDSEESDYSDSEYSYSDSYSSGSYSSDEETVDETLKAIRAAQRAKELRAKFEEWEQTQDAKDQVHQIMIHDENGDSLDTANNLRAKFEALQMQDKAKEAAKEAAAKFKVKRFK